MRISEALLAVGILLGGASDGWTQAVAGSQSGVPVAVPQAVPSGGPAVAAPDIRTEKQKALAKQTERLFDMATELKVQVDKTNKNILSLKVVEKAEEIELLAKGMKTEARR